VPGRYDKPALTVAAQAERLAQRGLQFDDDARVRHYLTHIGYYRLSAYWLPFELPSTDGQSRNHRFRPGTTFDQVLSLYTFDRQLRLLVMEAMERIETAVRSHWSNALATRYGPHAHMNANLFKSPWQHAVDIARISSELQSSNETFVAHYRRQYNEPFLPPIWAVAETLSFGALSRWFAATKDTSAKREVARGLGMPTIEVLEGVLQALTIVRNVCAHHGRLWNRSFVKQLPLMKRLREQMKITRTSGQLQPARHVYNYLLVMAYLMSRINPGSSWKTRLMRLLAGTDKARLAAMGFPSDWEQKPVWT